MRNIFIILTSIIILVGCSGINGKIENRNDSFYIVNESIDQIYRFTVKKTEMKDGRENGITTEFIDLYPGDEQLLGLRYYNPKQEYPIKIRKVLKTHKLLTLEEIEQELKKEEELQEKAKENPLLLVRANKLKGLYENSKDTIINGEKVKFMYIEEEYVDRDNPYPTSSFEYKYEVTGQVVIKQ